MLDTIDLRILRGELLNVEDKGGLSGGGAEEGNAEVVSRTVEVEGTGEL